MNIGVARPSPTELAQVPHRFIASESVANPLTAGQFEKRALSYLVEDFANNPIQVMTGGSGLFSKAVTDGFDEVPPSDPVIREKWNQVFLEKGIIPLQKALLKEDPNYYQTVDLNNHMRVIRALEAIEITGQPFSSFHGKSAQPRPFHHIKICLDWPREILYNRINQRVDIMVAEGLLEEAKYLYEMNNPTVNKTVGYAELFEAFRGNCSIEEAIDKIKQHSRNFAKRQMTWFRKESDIRFVNPEESVDWIGLFEDEIAKFKA